VEYVKIDAQGRLVIPARLRKLLGIVGETEALVRVEGRRIVIEPVSRDLEARVRKWVEAALNSKAEPFSGEVGESWKWVSAEYAGRKLGLLP